MTALQKYLVSKLLKDAHYLREWKSTTGRIYYRLYDKAGNPVRAILYRTYKGIGYNIWKRDNIDRITLHLNNVRQLHGNNIIKKLYKQHQTEHEKADC